MEAVSTAANVKMLIQCLLLTSPETSLSADLIIMMVDVGTYYIVHLDTPDTPDQRWGRAPRTDHQRPGRTAPEGPSEGPSEAN